MAEDYPFNVRVGDQYHVFVGVYGNRKNQYTYVGDIAEGSVAVLPFEDDVLNLILPNRSARLLSYWLGNMDITRALLVLL